MADHFALRIGDAVTATIRGGMSGKDIPVKGTVHATADDGKQVQVATDRGIYVWLPAEDVVASPDGKASAQEIG